MFLLSSFQRTTKCIIKPHPSTKSARIIQYKILLSNLRALSANVVQNHCANQACATRNDKKITRAWTYCAGHIQNYFFDITSLRREWHHHWERTLKQVHYLLKTIMTWGATISDQHKAQNDKPNKSGPSKPKPISLADMHCEDAPKALCVLPHRSAPELILVVQAISNNL